MTYMANTEKEVNKVSYEEQERQFISLLKRIPKDELWRVEQIVDQIYNEELTRGVK